MLREIKFRGKRLDTGEWVYGNLIISENGAPYILPPEICEVDGHHLRQGDDVPHWVDPATVGQFTGEFDDLGVEIYEDDLVEYPECVDFEEYEWGAPLRPRPIIMRTRHQVKFIDGCFWLMPATDGGDDPIPLHDLEGSKVPKVFGNIHDNPELLKK